MKRSELEALIRAIPDFPKPGILFRDITPLLKDPRGFATAVDLLADEFVGEDVDFVVAVEARGYVIGAPLAYKLGAGLIPVRKPGKLPYTTIKADYALEYGTNTLEVHADAITAGHRVIIVDDLLATGGTAAATKTLVERLGGEVIGAGFIIELAALGGRAKLGSTPVRTLLTY
ncbi:MAG TPA: adenine phosphoribosyltransferase [Candidatus Acidoferrales bacterium]|nr:adenine phosphoribosyltransferase [Candidatus Acidoferrales bacterium]